MTGSQGRASGRGPVLIDHVLIPVLNLESAARDFSARYGLVAEPGGRHPGVGTANQLVPLGSTYLELIAVVDPDQAARSPRSLRVLDAARAGRPFVTWAARTTALAAVRERLLQEGWTLPEPHFGARLRPDGVRLEWTSQDLAAPGQPSVLPFLIEWRVPASAHPAAAAVAHPAGAGDIIRLHLRSTEPAQAQDRLRAVVGDGIDFVVEPGRAEELVAIELALPNGTMTIP